MNEDFAKQIKQIVGREFDLDWQHPFDLAIVFDNYLQAKRPRRVLTPPEKRLAAAVAGMFDPLVGGDDVIFVAPNWPQAATLVALAEADDELDLTDFQNFGQKLTANDFQYFSWHRRFDALALSGWAFQAVLNGFAERHPIDQKLLSQVFGQAMTKAYWPLSQQLAPHAALAMFYLLVQIAGEWVLVLMVALQDDVDSKLLELLLLWLKLVELTAGDGNLLALVKPLMTALQVRDFKAAQPLLIQMLPALLE